MNVTFWAIFSCCVAERIWELFRSTQNQRRLVRSGFSNFEPIRSRLKMIFFHAVWVIATFIEAWKREASIPLPLAGVCILAIAIAFGLRIWTLRTLGAHWNISIMAPDESASNVQSPQSLFVTDGPYRYIRHPNYLAVILELAAIPMLGGAFLTAIGFSIGHFFILRGRIHEEEQHLFSRPGYSEAVGSRPRFFPRINFVGR